MYILVCIVLYTLPEKKTCMGTDTLIIFKIYFGKPPIIIVSYAVANNNYNYPGISSLQGQVGQTDESRFHGSIQYGFTDFGKVVAQVKAMFEL